MEAAAWFLLLTHTQVQKETDTLKELLGKVESEFEDLENFWPIYIAKKMKKYVLERIPRRCMHKNLIKISWIRLHI